MEDANGNIHLKNLSVHDCANEQDGIDLLMMGNFTRHVSRKFQLFNHFDVIWLYLVLLHIKAR